MHFQPVRQKKWNIHNETNKYRWHFRSKPHQTTSLIERFVASLCYYTMCVVQGCLSYDWVRSFSFSLYKRNWTWIWKIRSYEYKKRLLLRCIHHFKSDWINNMDHMRISGTEPSSVILSQKCILQTLKRDVPNEPKQAEAKRDGVINPHNYNFKQF